MESAPLQKNQVTLDMLQQLFFSESKPKNLRPVDVSIMAYLTLRRCADHHIVDSYLTIADRVCSDRQTVARSLDRLDKLGWITVAGRGRGLTRTINVNADAFPAAQPIRDQISPDARQLANLYFLYLQKIGRSRFPKNWVKRQIPSAQRVLTKCGGDLSLARTMVGFALSDQRFKARAKMSLYNVLTIWAKLVVANEEREKAIAAMKKATEESKNDDQCSAAA
jgi:hypothetical protein